MKLEPSFLKEKSEYRRTYYPIPHYIEQCAHYLAREKGIPFEKALEYVKGKFKSGEVKPSERSANILAKDENGDRYKKTVTLFDYFRTIKHHNLRVAPTFTTYVGPDVKVSLYGGYIQEKAKLRKGFKKLKFVYSMQGDMVNESFYDSLQNSCKIKINSLSGTHSSPGTVGFLKSGHSTLTSVCRVITSTANATNEKFIAGNRHYYAPLITLINIIALTNDAKNHPVAETIAKYNLVYPTVKQAIEVVKRSASPYWTNEDGFLKIEKHLAKLTNDELAFFVYGMDLYHVELLNPEFTKKLFEDFTVVSERNLGENPDRVLKEIDNEDLEILALLNCAETAGGVMMSDLKKKQPETYNRVCATAEELAEVQNGYSMFFRTFFRPNLLPPSFADIPSMYRMAIPLSDTDSCVFSNQERVLKYHPDNPFTHQANVVNYTMTYFITQIVAHSIAMLSLNLGLRAEQIGGLAMKNEYCFPVLWLTELAKHYYALKSAQEGNIFPKMKEEIKGVNLRNSAASKDLNDKLNDFFRAQSEKLVNNEKISMSEVHRMIADLEYEVFTNIRSGGSKYLRSMQIKDEDSYTQKSDAPAVKQHNLWEEVFAPKYGAAPDLPYRAVTLKLATKGKARMEEWFASIEDKTFVARLREHLEANNRKDLTTIRLPVDIVSEIGIPSELLDVAQIREVVKMIMNPFYIAASCLGLNLVNSKVSYLYSDDYYQLNDVVVEEDGEESEDE